MPRDVRLLLAELLAAGEELQQYVAGMTFDEYASRRLIRRGVERMFIIIGELLGAAIRADPTLEKKITEARDIVDFRNLLVHDYSVIRADSVWSAIQEELPTLLHEVRSSLGRDTINGSRPTISFMRRRRVQRARNRHCPGDLRVIW